MLKPGSNGGDLNGDYAFAKYNKKIVRPAARGRVCRVRPNVVFCSQELYEYNDAEWDALGLGDAPGWTRAETDYLLALCAQYDLRFHVIADRYHYQQPEADAAAQQPACVVRSVEELKGRYYSIAHALIQSRTDTPDQIAHKELIRHPYQAAAESERRELLTGLLCRTSGADAEEEALLASASAVEARRRQEVEQARASGQPLPAYCRPAGKFPELSIVSLEDLDTEKDPGGPSLPTPRGGSTRPPRGVYVRGVHTIAMATELVTHAFASSGGRPRDKKGLENFNKKIDLALEELGVRPPHTATRGVCRAWYALRREVAELLELRAQLARRSREAGGVVGGGAAGAPAATPYGGHQIGGVDGLGSPLKARSHTLLRGCVRVRPSRPLRAHPRAHASLAPQSPPWARAETPGSGAPLSAEEEEGRMGGPQQAKRDHKRKPNPRYEGTEATSPKEGQAASKKKKRTE